MNSKKLVLSLIAMLGVSAVSAISAYATTWYVRDGGGTSAQCTGTTNAIYTGSGLNSPCALNHPAWVMGGNNAGQGGGGGPTPVIWSGGDTLSIDGDSDTTPGIQAQYMIGYGMPNAGSVCTTNTAYAPGCEMFGIPAGPNSKHRTTIIGTGTHKPQLWGTQGMWFVLIATNNNLDIENIEITDHSSCSYQISNLNTGYNGSPAGCNGTGGSYPFGTYAKAGLELQGDSIVTANLFVHGLALDDIWFPGNVSNWSSTNDVIQGAGNTLDDGGAMTFSGNNTMTGSTWAFGGCSEKYPLPNTDTTDTTNYLNCCDQNQGCLGGGFMMQNNGNAACGNWTITNSKFLFNLKTNIDFLHCDGTGTFNMYRSISEGSSGEAIKLNVHTVNIEESQLIGDAPVWGTTPFQNIKVAYQATGGALAGNYLICRGGNSTIYAMTNGGTVNLINDDIEGNCTDLVGVVEDTVFANHGCAGFSLNSYNNKFIGGYGWDINEPINLFYNSGNDGNGSGSCGTGVITPNHTNDSCYNTASCAGYGIMVSSDPLVLGESSLGAFTNWVGPKTYYSGRNFGGLLALQSSSPLKGVATPNLTFTNGSSNDYNNFPQNTPPDIGAIQYGSCIAANNNCSINSECCGGNCNSEGKCKAPQPVVTITSPTSGSSFTSGSNVIITVTASETNGTISNISIYSGVGVLLGESNTSPFNYIDTNIIAGTYTFVAQATDAYGVLGASNPVTVTVTAALIPPSLPVVAISSPSGSTFTAGSNVTITAAASETNGTVSNISIYNAAGVLLGMSSTSPYNYVANSLLAGTYSYTAQAVDVNGVSVTSSPVTVTITPPPSPVVAITSPNSGSSFIAGSYITITAAASEVSGTISKVAFYSGSTLLGTATGPAGSGAGSPYSYTWNNVPAGNYSLTAIAYDNNNNKKTSTAVAVVVSGLPVVSLASNNTSFTAPANIILTASASEANGTISKVVFYNGSTLIGTATGPAGSGAGSPYRLAWVSVPSGNYSLTAIGYDNNNNQTTSTAVAVAVSGLPVVNLASNNTTFTAPANIILTATASEANGTISKVAFYNGATLIGTATIPAGGGAGTPYRLVWVSVPSGNYSLTAIATDANGVSTTSRSIIVTVAVPSVPPSITTQPVSVTVTAPLTATFTAAAGGVPTPTYQWEVSTDGGGSFTPIGTAVNTSYTITSTTTAMSGNEYEFVAKNGVSPSAISNVVSLTVNPTPVPPSITTQPVSVTVTVPSTATFTVAAAGVPAPTYQWMQSVSNGAYTNISGATSASYITAATIVANSGTTYECMVSNASGSVTSNAGILTVNSQAVPTVSIMSPVNNASYTTPANLILTANASEAGGTISKVVYYNGSALLGTVTNSPYRLMLINAPSGTYHLTAKAIDNAGVSTTSTAVAVTVNTKS